MSFRKRIVKLFRPPATTTVFNNCSPVLVESFRSHSLLPDNERKMACFSQCKSYNVLPHHHLTFVPQFVLRKGNDGTKITYLLIDSFINLSEVFFPSSIL